MKMIKAICSPGQKKRKVYLELRYAEGLRGHSVLTHRPTVTGQLVCHPYPYPKLKIEQIQRIKRSHGNKNNKPLKSENSTPQFYWDSSTSSGPLVLSKGI